MKKILIISTVGLIYDGITSVITSYLDVMDISEMEIYVAGTIEVKDAIRIKIEERGGHIIELPNRRTNTVAYAFQLMRLIRKKGIDVIHAHGNSATLAIEMVAAWLGGCKKRIAHSHNTKCDQVKADKILRPIFNLFYTDALACGEAAGTWLFEDRPFVVLKNGRDIEKFRFDSAIRKQIRKELLIQDNIVIGHVGGFVYQKNHEFLIKIYREILKILPNAKLFLIGDGVLRKRMEHQCRDIEEHIIFTGNTDRIPELLQAMDGMLLPSLFEGLPLVVIEWQLNGLPSLISSTVTEECKVTDFVERMSLECTPEQWAKRIVEMISKYNREENASQGSEKIKAKGFDIRDSVKMLEKMYLEQ